MTPEEIAALLKSLERAGMTQGVTTRASGMRAVPSTFDAKRGAVRFVASTEKPATVFDWERWEFVDEILVADGMEVPDSGSVRLLDSHSRYSVKDVLGSARDFQPIEVDGEAGRDCEVVFSDVADGKDAARKVEEGHITDVSVGYEVTEAFYVLEGEKQLIRGKEYEGPVKVSTKWELRELSLVPIGADSLAKVRSLAAVKVNQQKGEDDVNKKLRAYLESRGLAKNATDDEALAFMAEEGQKSDDARAEIERLKTKAAGNQVPAAPAVPSAAEIDAARADGERAERTRIADINEAISAAGLDADFGRGLVTDGVSIDAARAKIIDKLKERNAPVGAGGASNFEVGTESGQKFRAAAADGLAIRGGLRPEKPAPGASDFRGMSLYDVCRESLEIAGENTRGMLRKQVIARALSPASSSDFPALMSDLSGRHLLNAYNEAPPTWRPFVAVTGANDFKDIYGVSLSEAASLADLDENGEYKTANFKEKQERYRIITKGIKCKLTRQMIINDDLRAFTRITSLFGNAARRYESDAVYDLITSNPMMADGEYLFSTAHGNVAAAAGALSSDTLSVARTAMRKQKGMNGATLDIIPAFLLAPLEKETDSEILLRSTALPDVDMSSGVHNPWANRLSPVSDPRLSADSATAWYLMSSPSQAPVIEAAYLEGEEQPYIDEEVEFSSDSLVIKVRHDFGCGLMDHVGIYRNAGQ